LLNISVRTVVSVRSIVRSARRGRSRPRRARGSRPRALGTAPAEGEPRAAM